MAIARAPLSQRQRIVIAGLMLPLASILLYRNRFPYFYAFILPPVMVGTALAIKQILDRISVKMIAIALLANAAIISLATPRVVLPVQRSEEHTSEIQSIMRISYAVFCLKQKYIRQEDTCKHLITTILLLSH